MSSKPASEPQAAQLELNLLRSFEERFGAPATFLVRAPGRVNLLGEHTDYNDGFVLPMAIEHATWIALRPRADHRVIVWSTDFDEQQEFDFDRLGSHQAGGWIEYVKGTAWALGDSGRRLRGWEGVVAGEVPIGAGLSSSAALEVATARAFMAASDLPWDAVQIARACQRAENEWVGVQCGIMDQLIVSAAQEGAALLIDCRDLSMTPHRVPASAVVAVLDTSTRRELADSAFNQRRLVCREAARLLGAKSLREVDPDALVHAGGKLPQSHLRLARHVVGENARTLAAVSAMEAGDPVRVGKLMSESHVSLRDDYEVSSAALDDIVTAAWNAPGCYGARMTGAGFAGCAVALVDASLSREFAQAVETAYREKTGLTAAVYVCRPSAGASVRKL
jgi:galactokinase